VCGPEPVECRDPARKALASAVTIVLIKTDPALYLARKEYGSPGSALGLGGHREDEDLSASVVFPRSKGKNQNGLVLLGLFAPACIFIWQR